MKTKLYLRVEKAPTRDTWRVRETICNGVLFECEWRSMAVSYVSKLTSVFEDFDVPYELTIESNAKIEKEL